MLAKRFLLINWCSIFFIDYIPVQVLDYIVFSKHCKACT